MKGIRLDSATVEARGLEYDRRWMLTDRDGMFLTQREFPQMATLRTELIEDGLVISCKKWGGMQIGLPGTDDVRPVTIWQSVCAGEIYSEDVNEWFSMVLETNCQLVYMPDDSRRSVNPRFDRGEDIVSFADGYPLMLLGENSLVDLNSRLETPLPMNRFRPNLVVSGCGAFAEDNWTRIRIGEAIFRSTKPCERCVITTVEQSKGEFAGKEPLKTLASYRSAKTVMPERLEALGVSETAVLFGQNLIAEGAGGTIKIGDEIEMLA